MLRVIETRNYPEETFQNIMEPPSQRNLFDSLQERRHSTTTSPAEKLDVTASTASNDHKVSNGGAGAARSRGWVPLSFPRSALLKHPDGFHHQSATSISTTSNRYFPLHEDVVLATVRELLLLDGTLDPVNLKVRNIPSKFLRAAASDNEDGEPAAPESCDGVVVVVAPRFWCHMNPSHWVLAPEVSSSHRKGAKTPKNGAMMRKRKNPHLPKSLSPRKKQMTECTLNSTVREQVAKIMESKLPLVISSLDEQPDLVDEDVRHGDDAIVPVAEYVAYTIARRSYAVDNRVRHDVMQRNRLLLGDESKLPFDEDEQQRYPRKVSDVDQEMMLSTLKESIQTAIRITEEDAVGDLDIARFIHLSERTADGTFPLKRTDLPTLLDASIATESSLREEAIRMTNSMTRSFTDSAIRLFLGYKAPTLKRDRLIQVLADFLFDASHAMFAWDQTMQELLANKSLIEPLSSKQWNALDKTVKNSLFDERALRKIGGFEPSSVLPHAISISRLRKRGLSWEAFSKTADGKRLLAHHRSGGDNLLAGQKRRGHRQRHRVLIPSEPSSDKVERSRCSSVGSADMDGLVSDDSVPELPFFADVPSTAQVHLARDEGASWGILLAKEGDMCVVARAGGSTDTTTKRRGGEIRCGDMILRCTNERGETACTPCSSGHRQQPQEIGWFRTMVDIFKSSKELHLAIQRVGA